MNLELGGSVVVSRNLGLALGSGHAGPRMAQGLRDLLPQSAGPLDAVLGKSLQVLPCRSGSGSVEQKIPAGHEARGCVVSPQERRALHAQRAA